MNTQDIALNKLVLSPLNMRQGEVDVSDLLASFRSRIAAKKPILLQNLRVTAQVDDAGKATGLYEVHVGGRRFRALSQLAEAKTIKKTHPVTCVVTEDRLDAMSESVEENTQRLDPHPADQYLAFAALIDSGYTPAQVAGRFGIEEVRVHRRMALAKVSPKLMDLYRTGEIDYQQMMAFTLTEDQAAQEAAYFDFEGWQRNANSIRQRLTQGEVNAKTNKLAKLVGLDAYREAGGSVRRDLFAEANEGYIQDPALMDKLAGEVLESAAEEVRGEGWKWVRVEPTLSYQDTEGLDRVYPVREPLDDATAQQVEELSTRYQAMEAEGADETDEGYEAMQAVERQIAELEATAGEAYRPEEVAVAGAFVTVESDGAIKIQRGFVAKADKKAYAKIKDAAKAQDGSDDQPKTASEVIEEGAAGLSGALKENLSAHHTAAIRAALLDNPNVALVATVHRMLIIGHYRSDVNARDIGALRLSGLSWNEDVNKHAPDLAESPARAKLDAAREAMQSRLPEAAGDLWAYLLPMPVEGLLELLAYAASYQVFAIQSQFAPKAQTASAYAIADALALDMADYWTPTAANYFSRVGKPDSVAAVREVVGDAAADEMASLKKGELAAQAEVALDGSRWLPAMLRRIPADEASSDLADAA